MDKSLDPRFGPYRLGQVVLSRRGKDRGNRYVVVGFPEEDRLALADADRFNEEEESEACAADVALCGGGRRVDTVGQGH